MGQAAKIQRLDIVRGRLEHHLVLVIVLQSSRVFAVSAVRRTTTGLWVARPPGLRAEGSQEGRGMEGASSHLEIIRLVNDAALVGPIAVQREEQLLKGHRSSLRLPWIGVWGQADGQTGTFLREATLSEALPN